ncbi:hypothetical protein PR048_031180 [Dryococelus australis]|uniref:Uncharacterized protein n=1 Tax=Dryococelus australis TaxID=614101 RepID=A0ABQ9G4J2_9NEOP|nr:hypothetical protein PR048_031180 [Dryococelus australis]
MAEVDQKQSLYVAAGWRTDKWFAHFHRNKLTARLIGAGTGYPRPAPLAAWSRVTTRLIRRLRVLSGKFFSAGCSADTSATQQLTKPPRPFAFPCCSDQVKCLRHSSADAGMKGRGKREIPEKTHLPAASSDRIPTCENPECTGRGFNPVRLGGRD